MASGKAQAIQQEVWRPLDQLDSRELNAGLRQLLGVRQSLTGTLRDLCGADFRLAVLAQSDLVGDNGQATGAGLRREVLLNRCDVPWVFAETLVPAATLDLHPWLAQLGQRPLGDVLFGRTDVSRSAFEYRLVFASEALFRKAWVQVASGFPAPRHLWARRSEFRVAGAPFQVNEIFFPWAGQTDPA